MTPLRRGRPDDGGDRRARIVASATRLFADEGFDAVSLRQVARDAGVDPALVHHYFSGKDELFAASVELPADPDDVLAGMASLTAQDRGTALLSAIARLWEGPQRHALAAFVRGSLGSRARTAAVREVFRARVMPRVLEGLEGPREELELRATLAATQVMGFILLRYVVQLEPLASLPREQAIALVAPTLQHYLTGELADPDTGPGR
ncbi:TetR/AcrR family transcriptional regulator [Sinomonas sp. R1AF57]|uniref:TetR/AcrR family transcriptional regulator n=1 Tax=Sinomonas sp. R1AF57 TaxID=2020377 RepID=UPI000B60DFFD|nr:TetR family transcriptional regulator [Sinomonas sp. R1AF57]ASN51606.1 TetR family transcriptional regulator [Sinomonas sp. R1AF57]